MSTVGEIMHEGSINELSIQLEKLSYLFSTLYFGTPTLEEMVENIKLSRWIKAYQLLINESKKFLSTHTSRSDYRIKKYCIKKRTCKIDGIKKTFLRKT